MIKLAQIISDESRLCRDCTARDINGNKVAFNLEEAHAFCLIAAVAKYVDSNYFVGQIMDTMSGICIKHGYPSTVIAAEQAPWEEIQQIIQEFDDAETSRLAQRSA